MCRLNDYGLAPGEAPPPSRVDGGPPDAAKPGNHVPPQAAPFLSSFYWLVFKGLNGVDWNVVYAILDNCTNLFALNLPGSSVLVSAFLRALRRLVRNHDTHTHEYVLVHFLMPCLSPASASASLYQFVFHPPSLGDAQKRKGLTLLASMSGLTQLFAEDATIPVFTPAGVVVNTVMPGLVATSASSKPAKDGSDVQLAPIETFSTEESPIQPESAAPAPADADAMIVTAPTAAPAPIKLEMMADDEPPVPPSPSEVAVTLLATNTLTEPDEQPRPGRQPRWSELDVPVPDGKPLVEANVVPFSVVRGIRRQSMPRATVRCR